MERGLILNGSPRGKEGNTARLVEKFTTGLKQEKDIELDYVELKERNINNCTGCFSCWSETPGECIHQDDMSELFHKYIETELIIWATPLYHYGMSTILKKFIERTLPLNKPDIIEENGTYKHPKRYESKDKKNVLISTCGFPERDNFRILKEHFNELTDGLEAEMLTVMGELLTKKPLQHRLSWYFEAVKKAGREFAQKGAIGPETEKTLKQKLVPVEDFIEMANASWQQEQAGSKREENQEDQAYNLLTLMKQAFNPEAAEGLEAVLEFEFTDLETNHHFVIKDGECSLKRGSADDFTAKIITTYDIWQQISKGELDGDKALMAGKYKIDGELSLVRKHDWLFAVEDEEDKNSQKEIEREKGQRDSMLTGQKALKFSFLPWILTWIFVETSWLLGLLVPLIYSAGLIMFKNYKSIKITYFEKGNLFYFAVLNIMGIYNYEFLQLIGIEFNYFAVAVLWGGSLLFERALTGEYSRYDYPPEIAESKLFQQVNNIITLVWTGIYLVMGLSIIVLKGYELMQFSPLLYLLIIAGLIFTSYFPEKYQEYRKKSVELAPEVSTYRWRLYETYLELGEEEKAEEVLREILDMSDENNLIREDVEKIKEKAADNL